MAADKNITEVEFEEIAATGAQGAPYDVFMNYWSWSVQDLL